MAKPLLHRRESIIFTTIDVIGEFGIHGISTREVARREGISEAAVFKYFPKKKDLILSILDYYFQYDEDIMISIKEESNSVMDKIMCFFSIYAEYYQNYPQISTVLLSYEALSYDKVLKERIRLIMLSRRNFVYELLIEGVQKKQISERINVDVLADCLIGTFRYKSLMWKYEGYTFSLKEEIQTALEMLIKLVGQEE